MRAVLASIACCLLLVSVLGASNTAAQADLAQELIQHVNDFRAENGMPPLAVHPALMAAAQQQADWQAINYIHSHQGEGGSMPQDRANAAGYGGLVNENVASGTLGYVTPAWAVKGWASSYGHRMTMLADKVHMGVGVAQNDEEMFFVLVVGGLTGAPLLIPMPEPEEDVEPTAAAVAVVVVPIVIATPGDDGSVVHVVQRGQTAWAIAARYGVSLDDLRAINHLGANAVLHPGDRLIVRLGSGQEPPPAPTLPVTHIVRSGDTLWSIAATYGLTLDELLALNGLARGAIIKEGDEVRLRAAEPTPTETSTPAPTRTATATAPATVPVTAISSAAATVAATVTTTATATTSVAATPAVTVSPSPTAASTPAPPRRGSADTDDSAQTALVVVIVGAAAAVIASFAGLVLMARRLGA